MAPSLLPPGAAIHLRGVFRAEQDERVVGRAIEQGHLTQADADTARDEVAQSDDSGATLVQRLTARGLLDPKTTASIEASLAREAFVRAPVLREAPLPPEVQAAAADPGRHLGDFVLCDLKGRGGAGEVWRAWDRRLDRWVALKLSTAPIDSVSGRERFEREALAAGRLSHPNIVPIYQVGIDRDRVFLVMPFIDGNTLDQAALPIPQALEVMQKIAMAVEHAHQRGLVHRDIKPGNIMIDRSGNAFVLDFGLAHLRQENSSRLTRPGDVLGTAAYMSPEQARGDETAHGVHTDVYGLGATLYHLVTHKAPFRGDSFAAVVAQVLQGEPVRPRKIRPDIDLRVETIIETAMASDPKKRYQSAAAFADDLARVLADNPTRARPRGLEDLLKRGLRRHAVLTMAGLGVLVAGGLIVGFRARVQNERRAAVDALRDVAQLQLETALQLRRAGETRAMHKALPRLQIAYDRVRARGVQVAEVEYLMGRMHRALLNEDVALVHQERALREDPGFAPALYERTVLMSSQYGRLLDDVLGKLFVSGGSGVISIDAAEVLVPDLRRLREMILADCTRLESLPVHDVSLADATRGLLAYQRGQYKQARLLLGRSLAAVPDREELWDARARAEELDNSAQEASASYTEAIRRDRGYVPHLVGRCEMRRRMNDTSGAIEDATLATQLDPDFAEAWMCLGNVLLGQGHTDLMTGGDPQPRLAQAVHDFAEALRASKGRMGAAGRASVHRYLSIYKSRIGEDPMPDLAASEQFLDQAIAAAPQRPDYRGSRGRTLTRRAEVLMERNEDPSAQIDRAIQDLNAAEALDRRRPDAWDWRGIARTLRGRWKVEHGQDPSDDFAAAKMDLAEALRLYSGDGWTNLHMADLGIWKGRAETQRGEDPTTSFDEAEKDLTTARQILQGLSEPWVREAELQTARALAARKLGFDPARSRVAAAYAIDRALAIDPKFAEAWLAMAELEDERGSPERARVAAERAVSLNRSLAHRLTRLLRPGSKD